VLLKNQQRDTLQRFDLQLQQDAFVHSYSESLNFSAEETKFALSSILKELGKCQAGQKKIEKLLQDDVFKANSIVQRSFESSVDIMYPEGKEPNYKKENNAPTKVIVFIHLIKHISSSNLNAG